ncbi:3-hydroxyacyl-CoA dehydrogenase NAD-binding domain-containing protein, partial [Lentzea sp. NPDC060358]|uniref:3-hydroxyacyl-CoA dehydrogenase NAD-binding domain-containing protein n=1 Tax=Lentzea sp. NPDC060358 TaxID=3347103 RepID=UPI00365E0054
MSAVRRAGVVGCGLMGAGVAEVCARADLDVLVLAPSAESAGRGRARVTESLDRLLRKGKLTEQERDRALGHVAFTTDITALADRDFVLEAIAESAADKAELFKRLDEVVIDPAAVLASTTSSVSISALAAATTDPGRVVG